MERRASSLPIGDVAAAAGVNVETIRFYQRKGLLSGERLYLQLKQMESAYVNANRRGYELTKHYSLVQNDPPTSSQ